MKSNRILELVKILESHDISEIEVSRWGRKIRIAKNVGSVAGSAAAPQVVPAAGTPQKFVEIAGLSEEHTESENSASETGGVEIKSPLVGTFYQAPAPDAEPYVKIGDQISIGQPLCIIEAMKIMNLIESEVTGKLTKIQVGNAQSVEYNQTLFVVEPA
jgi:acetyl-CoA carboxylase biotin carboxyl carrier protein